MRSADSFVAFDYNISLPLANRLMGTVFIELYDDRPVTRDNFLQYVNSGVYNNSLMHRLSPDFVLQGGGYYAHFQADSTPIGFSLDSTTTVDLDGNPATQNPMIINEFNNTPLRSNVRGTLAMAKLDGNPNSASSEYFFNLEDNGGTSPNGLDYQNGGFTVFARVVGDGLTLLDAYNTTATHNGLPIVNLNADGNHDGQPDSTGPFSQVPIILQGNSLLVLALKQARQIDYLGNGITTNIPSGGLAFTSRDAFIDTGTVLTGSGGLTVGADRELGIRENFSLGRNLSNHGTVAPGLQLGTVTAANYFQYPDGKLEIDLAGTTAGTQYDRLVATGGAFLGGELRVSLLNGLAPAPNNSFTVLTASSIIGNFSSIDLPQLTAGYVWNYSQTATTITLSVAAADYNHNGVVDADDYIIWRKMRNKTVPSFTGADGNGDGVVNDADYTIWRNNLGNRSGSAAGAGAGSLVNSTVPEPTGAILFVSLGLLLAANRRCLRIHCQRP